MNSDKRKTDTALSKLNAEQPLINKGISGRNPSMDLIRCLALLLVNSVHFFLFTGFYQEPLTGKRVLLMAVMRTACMVCVPLFMILSGFLMSRKPLEKGIYRKGLHTLWIYLLASGVCALYRLLLKHETMTAGQAMLGILKFRLAPYSWYIEMYAGLFLLMPFLNIAYGKLPSKTWKQIFVITLLFMTAMPGIVNVYPLEAQGWVLHPSRSDHFSKLIPQYWIDLYPVTYYVIGCYLREYGFKIRKRSCLLLILVSVLTNGLYNIWRSDGGVFKTGLWNDWGAFPQVVTASLLFVFFDNLDLTRLSDRMKIILSKISGLCLGAYLVSWVFDDYLYQVLNQQIPYVPWKLPYFFLVVPCVYICSLILSWGMEKLLSCISRLHRLLR